MVRFQGTPPTNTAYEQSKVPKGKPRTGSRPVIYSQNKQLIMIRHKIKLLKLYPESASIGTIFYPDSYHYKSENHSISFEDVKKFKNWFKELPLDYTIKSKEAEEITSVKRHYDGTIFKIGDKYKNSLSSKIYTLTGFILEDWTVTLLYKEGKNCGINNATKIKTK